MSESGTSQPWQLPRRTAGHGSKADAGAQPLADSQSASRRIAELETSARHSKSEAMAVSGSFSALRRYS